MRPTRLVMSLAVVAVGVIGIIGSAPAVAQDAGREASDWTVPRTADGRPDLQGFWTTQTFTPLERPEYLGDKAVYTEEEFAQLQAQLTAEGVDPLARQSIQIADDLARDKALYQTNRDAEYVHYDNNVWLATDVPKGLSTRRTSLITDPPTGRMPSVTRAARDRRAAARAERRDIDPFHGYEVRPLGERCIVYGHNGPPMLPPAYNDIHQIFQTEDHVAVFTEMTNNAPRIIPMDGRPHISDAIRQFPGDSRGRWEGDTLVVESTNFNDKRRFQGSSEHLHVVERFTRISEDEMRYEFTVTDPATWDSPWSVEIPMLRTEGPMYEYACHEGNYDLRHLLEISRNLERQAAEAASR